MPEFSDTSPSSDAPPPAQSGANPRHRKWRRLRRFLFWSLIVAAVLAIFHRPLLQYGIRLALVKFSAKQHIALKLEVSGTIFTNLLITNVLAEPDGSGPSPVGKISIASIRLDYSIPHLIQHGVGELLSSYEIVDADLVFVPLPDKSDKDKEQKKSLAQDLNDILAQPALYADRVRIQNFSITVRLPDAVTEVRGFDLFLHPWEPGYLRIAHIQVPGLPAWNHLSAETSYVGRNLYIEHLAIAPEMVLDVVNFDASQRAAGKGSTSMAGHFFGGTVEFSAEGTQLKKKGVNLQKAYSTLVRLDVREVDVQAAAKYLGDKVLPLGRVAYLSATFRGEPELPPTWDGGLSARVEQIGDGPVVVDHAELGVEFKGGRAKITWGDVVIGKNALTFDADLQLPPSVNQFSDSDGRLTFQLSVPDPDAFLPKTDAGVLQKGTLTGRGVVTLKKGKASVETSISGGEIESRGLSAAALHLRLTAEKDLHGTGSPFAGLVAQVNADAAGLRVGGSTIDSLLLDAAAEGPLLTLRHASVKREKNEFDASGVYDLDRGIDSLAAEFTLDAPDLAAFGVAVKDQILGGRMEGRGKMTSGPEGLSGDVQLAGSDFVVGGFQAKQLVAKVTVEKGEAVIEKVQLQVDPANLVAVTGKVSLKEGHAYEGAALALLKDVSVFQPLAEIFGVQEALAGSVDFSVEGTGTEKEHSGKTSLVLEKIHYGELELPGARFAAIYGPAYAESSELHLTLPEATFDAGVEWRDGRLKLKDIAFLQGKEKVLSGFFSIPFEPGAEGGALPLEKRVTANLNAHQLDLTKLFAAMGKPAALKGLISASLVAGGALEDPSAHLVVTGRDLKFAAAPELAPAEFDINANYSEKLLTMEAAVRQKEIQPLSLHGNVPLDVAAIIREKRLGPDLPLDVTVDLPKTSLAIVSKFAPAVTAGGFAEFHARLAGTAQKPILTVGAKVEARNVKLVSAPQLGPIEVDFSAGYGDKVVSIKAAARQRDIKPVVVDGSLPLDLEAVMLGAQIPKDIPLSARLSLEPSSLSVLPKLLPKSILTAAGNVSALLEVAGTLESPLVHGSVDLAARNIKLVAAPQMPPADLDVKAAYQDDHFSASVDLKGKGVPSFSAKGRLDIPQEALKKGGEAVRQAPLEFHAALAPTSLGILPQFVKAVRGAAGTVGFTATVKGSIAKPQLSGGLNIQADFIHATSLAAPDIGPLLADVVFSDTAITVRKVHGLVGGGSFDLGGSVVVKDLANPVLNLRLISKSVLVKRDDSVTVRVDSDIKAAGPLQGGLVSGSVTIVQSRFLKEIDILPIALPGKASPKKAPSFAPVHKAIALPPPLDKLRFEIAIITKQDDPFLIRGNLASGSAMVDLKLLGVGAAPYLTGHVQVENLTASLPFSKVEVTRGYISFAESDPFEPKLDIIAESTLRDYRISIYISGSADRPSVTFTSEPPLPQQDILSLLATGTTSSELSGNSSVLASRAALLLFQELYHKVFKKTDKMEDTPLLDRLKVDVGAVDSKTGREEINASYRLTDRFYLVGDVDVTGAFTGRVRYIVRFK